MEKLLQFRKDEYSSFRYDVYCNLHYLGNIMHHINGWFFYWNATNLSIKEDEMKEIIEFINERKQELLRKDG